MSNSTLASFHPLFYPKSLAVVGASNEPGKFGNIILSALMEIGYSGRIYPVNPAAGEVNGLKVYRSLQEIPDEIDFAILTIPAPAVSGILEDCLRKGVKWVEILTSGFRETGTPEGIKMEEEIVRIGKKGLRIVGPNCFGVYCPESGLTILPGYNFPRESGPVGFLAQSGGLCADLGQMTKGLGIRFSKMVSYGNACDLEACDLLEYFFEDEKTKIIAGYIEGLKDGPRFLRLLQKNRGRKPVILWKGGLTATGGRAVMSHTGSLGGDETIWNAACKHGKVVQVFSTNELIDTIYAFLYLPVSAGPRVAVMGGGGAISVAASDTLDRLGLSVPVFSPRVQQILQAALPPVGNSLRNPVDLGNPMIPPSMLQQVMGAAAADDGIDTLIVIQILYYILGQVRHQLGMDDRPLSQFSFQPELLKACQEIRAKSGKAMILVLPDITTDAQMIDLEIEWRRERDTYQSAGFPVFKSLERAARALSHFVSWHKKIRTRFVGRKPSPELLS